MKNILKDKYKERGKGGGEAITWSTLHYIMTLKNNNTSPSDRPNKIFFYCAVYVPSRKYYTLMSVL
jgi:hypothetical protein